MLDRQYLEALLPILKLNGIKHIKMQGLELEFHVEQKDAPDTIARSADETSLVHENDKSIEHIVDAVKKQEESMPPDLRADSLMDQDKILNWSSPDHKSFEEEAALPLTGEMPL
jgi:hypothetical protein